MRRGLSWGSYGEGVPESLRRSKLAGGVSMPQNRTVASRCDKQEHVA